MSSFRFSIAVALAALTLLVLSQEAFACTCVEPESADFQFRNSANVVILKVRSLEKTEKEPPRLVNYGGIKQTILTVERVYKGNLKVGQELILKQGGGADCVWTFDEQETGQDFLFYLGKGPLDSKPGANIASGTGQFPIEAAKNVWIAWICSRSGSTKYRSGDINYLNNLSKVRGKTRLSGRVTQSIASSVEEVKPRFELLANHKIQLNGNGKKIELKTDENGTYEIYDLPSGKYKLTPEKVSGYKFDEPGAANVTVEIETREHTQQDFDFEINNAIRGKFYDKNGKPMKNVCLDLLPANGKSREYFREFDCTEEDGSWTLEGIPTGQYVILFNEDDELTPYMPFGKFFYPNSKTRENAGIISIGPGEFRENLIVVAQETADVVIVSGVLRFEDGKPVPDEAVEFLQASRVPARSKDKYLRPDSRAQTDENGRFTMRILKGQKGILQGEIMTYSGEYENCPKLENLIKTASINARDIFSPSVEIIADRDIAELELKFQFPSCRKAKNN